MRTGQSGGWWRKVDGRRLGPACLTEAFSVSQINAFLDFWPFHPQGQPPPTVAICLPFSNMMRSLRESFTPESHGYGCVIPPSCTSKISNPAMSRIPRNEAPCRWVLSRALFTRLSIQRKRRSYVALAKASMAKSACRGSEGTWLRSWAEFSHEPSGWLRFLFFSYL